MDRALQCSLSAELGECGQRRAEKAQLVSNPASDSIARNVPDMVIFLRVIMDGWIGCVP